MFSETDEEDDGKVGGFDQIGDSMAGLISPNRGGVVMPKKYTAP